MARSVGEALSQKRFSLKPRFTVVHHPLRKKYELSMAHYAVIDSIDHLSNNPDYPYCEEKKEKLADWLGISRSSVFDAVKIGLEKGFLEKNPDGPGERTTQKWIDEIRLYDTERE